MPKTFRTTTYEFAAGAFSGTSYELELEQNLSQDYFAIIIGGSSLNASRSGGDSHVRLSSDPFGTGSLNTSAGPKRIELSRFRSDGNWIGSVTIVECIGDQDKSGFRLRDVVTPSLATSDSTITVATNSSWTDINQVIPFGGIRGGGVTATESNTSSGDNCSFHGRFFPSESGSQEITWERDLTGGVATAAIATVHIVEWGSDWNIQRATVTGSSGSGGASSTAAYDTASINSVVRANTFVWGCGHTSDGGIGDSFSGTLVTLGDGVNQNANESTVAVGQEYSDSRTVDVYVAENSQNLASSIFKSDGDSSINELNIPIPSPSGSETFPDSGSSIHSGALGMPAMDGGDGGWAAFYGDTPVTSTGMEIVCVEDDIGDTDISHTNERIAYICFTGQNTGDIENSSGSVIGEYGVVSSVGNTGIPLSFKNAYIDPVVVVTNSMRSGDSPCIGRSYNISSSGCNVRLDEASATSSTARELYYIVLEKGAHTLIGGFQCEAGVIAGFSGLNSKLDWSATQMDQITPINSYSNPVIVGGVQTDNDSNFQAFWASGGSQFVSPTSSTIYIGRHIAEDTNATRSAEDLGYIVWETGNGLAQAGGRKWLAGLTDDVVEGLGNSPPYIINILNSVGISSTSGYRFTLQFNGCNGTGTAFPRPYFGNRITSENVMKTFRAYNGQNFPAWVQVIDLFNVEYSSAVRRVFICS